MSLIPGVTRKDTTTAGRVVGTVASLTMNPPTPQEYGRLSGTAANGTASTVACWGGAGTNATSL
tara:strand:+ start:2199 stop:2390 length:192 start_codon:yes stop_codon:yes gene_type:complete